MKKTAILLVAVLVSAFTLHAQSLLVEPVKSPEQVAADRVLAAPAQTRDAILGQLNDAFSVLWDSPNPQAILDKMGPGGTKAKRLFEINTKFAEMVAQLLIEEGDTASLAKFQAMLAKVPALTLNNDGTVTITPQASPPPEP